MKTFGYIALFAVIQAAALALAIVGLPICALLSQRRYVNFRGWLYHFPKWAWLWDNDEDGVFPYQYMREHLTWGLWRLTFTWTALRNPVNNFRFVPGVSKVGRPLWRKTFVYRGEHYYAQAGWNGRGYPVLSAGRNIYND